MVSRGSVVGPGWQQVSARAGESTYKQPEWSLNMRAFGRHRELNTERTRRSPA